MAMLSIGELALGSAATGGINTRIPWSALEYSAGTDVITSISGSSIGSTVDTSQLMPKSASADFYPASNPSGFVTGGPYQQSGDYVYESSFSAFSSNASASISSLSSIVSSISGNTGDYVEKSAISAESAKWNEVSGLSGKLDKSASSDFYSTSNPSGFISSADAATSFVYNSAFSSFSSETTGNIGSLSSLVSAISGNTGDYVEKSSISAESAQWNEVSGLSGKLDSSASSSFYPMSGNPSGFLTEADVSSSYIPISSLEIDENSAITGISGSSIGGVTGDYVEKSAFHLQIGTGNSVLVNTGRPNNGTWAVIGSGNNVSLNGSGFAANDVAHVLIGPNNSATWGTAIALGANNNSHGNDSNSVNILIGKNNYDYGGAGSRYGAAIGYNASAGTEAISIGQFLVSTNNSIAMGESATATDDSLGIHVGHRSYVTTPTIASSYAYAIGRENSAMRNSVAIGQGNSAASGSLSVGFLNTATHSSNLYGHGLVGDSGLTVLGQWNSASAGSGNTAFVFGDGSGSGSSQRHDLMLLLRSGDIIINGSSNSGVPIVSSIKRLSSNMSYSSTWGSVTGRIPYSALKYAEGTTTITAIYNSAIGGGVTGDYVEKSAISAESAKWNEISGLSGKLDTSASSSFYPMAGNPSSFLTESNVSSRYIPFSAIETDGNSAITAISGSAIGAESLNTAALVAGSGIRIDLSGDGNYHINNTAPRLSAIGGWGISASSYTDASGQEYTVLGLDRAETYEGTQFVYAIQSSFPATADEQEVPLVAQQGMPYGYTSYMVKLDAIVSCPYAATWSLVETYNYIWGGSASSVIALDRTDGGNSAMVHLRGETLAGGNGASARLVNVMVKFDENPVGSPTVTVHDQVGYFVRIPQGRIANGWWA